MRPKGHNVQSMNNERIKKVRGLAKSCSELGHTLKGLERRCNNCNKAVG